MTVYSIYKITNTKNLKAYIGWTSRNASIRIKEHLYKNNQKTTSLLSSAVAKYGADSFKSEVIYQSLDYEHSRVIERDFIIQHNSLANTLGGHGYNIDLGGKGHKRSSESIKKQSLKMKGRKHSQEHINKRKMYGENNPMYGKTGEKSSWWGRSHTEETKKKISESRTGKFTGTNHPNYGKKSPENVVQAIKDKNSKSYKIIFEDGSSEIIKNLSAYCRKYNISNIVFLRYHKNGWLYKGRRLERL